MPQSYGRSYPGGEIRVVTSLDSGLTWTRPQVLLPCGLAAAARTHRTAPHPVPLFISLARSLWYLLCGRFEARGGIAKVTANLMIESQGRWILPFWQVHPGPGLAWRSERPDNQGQTRGCGLATGEPHGV